MRINKFLANCEVASRRACDKLIEDGKIKVNGKTAKLGDDIDEVNDSVYYDGKRVILKDKKEYYIMNKPKGYVCTVSDDKGRKTVMNLLPSTVGRVYPVGRLDYDTEGLLILTNDGDLAFRLTHPKNEIPKTYLVKIDGKLTDSQLNKLRTGVEIDGVMTQKSKISIAETDKESTKIYVTIHEGKNRQVRKMFEAVDSKVDFLKRVKVGDLTLSGLDRGKVRKLSDDEVFYLTHL